MRGQQRWGLHWGTPRQTTRCAVALRRGDKEWERDVVTTVQMKRLSDQELNAYLASGDWEGKAGGYAIQGPAAALIRHIDGSYSNIVGFSLYDIAAMLRGNGVAA